MAVLGSLLLEASTLFEVAERYTPVDFTTTALFVLGLIFFITIQYKNQSVLNDLFSMSFNIHLALSGKKMKNQDTLDKIILGFIFLVSSSLLIYHFTRDLVFSNLSSQIGLYALPLILIAFFALPLYLVGLLLGERKTILIIFDKILPVLFLLGIILLALSLILFFQVEWLSYMSRTLIGLILLFILWIHVIGMLELIQRGFSLFYIFMYFCTLEILPLVFVWVYFSRM